MKTILITILLVLATVATGHETETQKQTRLKQAEITKCLRDNQLQIGTYLKCREKCENLPKTTENTTCSCFQISSFLKYCG